MSFNIVIESKVNGIPDPVSPNGCSQSFIETIETQSVLWYDWASMSECTGSLHNVKISISNFWKIKKKKIPPYPELSPHNILSHD